MTDERDELRGSTRGELRVVVEDEVARAVAGDVVRVCCERPIDRLATPAVDDDVELELLRHAALPPRRRCRDAAAVHVDREHVLVAGRSGLLFQDALPTAAAAREPLAEAGRRRPVEVRLRVVAVAELRVAARDDRAVAQRHVNLDDERLALG